MTGRRRDRPPVRLLLVDIGGGSTEFAVGSAGEPPAFVRSLDVGVVRLTERFFHADPPPAAEVAALSGHVAAAIETAVPAELRAAVRGAVGVAGTYTTLVANKLGMTEYDGRLVQGHVLSLADIDAAVARFAALTSAERGWLPGIQPGREDVILAGALIAREACRAFGLDAVRVSEADLLEGAALALADGSLAPPLSRAARCAASRPAPAPRRVARPGGRAAPLSTAPDLAGLTGLSATCSFVREHVVCHGRSPRAASPPGAPLRHHGPALHPRRLALHHRRLRPGRLTHPRSSPFATLPARRPHHRRSRSPRPPAP